MHTDPYKCMASFATLLHVRKNMHTEALKSMDAFATLYST